MTEPTHTKASWLLAEDGSPFVYALNERGFNRFWLNVYAGTHGDSDIQERTSDAEIMANARLIAAAPDLYAELQNIANIELLKFDDADEFRDWARNRARNAIARIKGNNNDY